MQGGFYENDLQTPGDLDRLKVTVMGLGLFGGGVGVTRFLVSCGARVTVTDLRKERLLTRSLERLEGLPVRFVLGKHCAADFVDTDLVVANPGVPSDSVYLAAAREAGVAVDSEINLTFRFLPTPHIVGITGSNGKTTTSHLTHRMVEACGRRAWLGGNMGRSLLPSLDEIGSDDVVVLELSSFQLETLGAARLGPRVAVLTNITPNHLDRHKTFENYVAAKAQIFNEAEAAVLNADDPLTEEILSKESRLGRILFSSSRTIDDGFFLDEAGIVEAKGGTGRFLVDRASITLPGVFNAENIMAGLGAVSLILGEERVPAAAVRAGSAFEGVAHRLETVCVARGVRYINDSIATTPESTIAALGTLDGDIALIAGGYDKQIPFDSLAAVVGRKVGTLLLIGETADKLKQAVRKVAPDAERPVLIRASGLAEAVRLAASRARAGSTVLLSPACASYDQFINFEERGAFFKQTVADMAGRAGID